MFERFTERARQVVVLAQDEARALRHNYIGTEHILLGLLREHEGIAARVLGSLDITVEAVREHVVHVVGRGDEVAGGQIPFTPRAKKVLELSMREARSLGHTYIGTEHILLGLARENEGVAMQILMDLGATPNDVATKTIEFLSGAAPEDYRESYPTSVAFDHEMPLRISDYGGRPAHVSVSMTAVVVGWLLFAIAAALGVLVGWLIWG